MHALRFCATSSPLALKLMPLGSMATACRYSTQDRGHSSHSSRFKQDPKEKPGFRRPYTTKKIKKPRSDNFGAFAAKMGSSESANLQWREATDLTDGDDEDAYVEKVKIRF